MYQVLHRSNEFRRR